MYQRSLGYAPRPGVSCNPMAPSPRRNRRPAVRCLAAQKPEQPTATKDGPTQDTGVGLKAVWYAAELFGKAIGKGGESNTPTGAVPMSRDAILESIRADYAENYFISGRGDMAAYAPDCVFADPFVSFKGVDRFKQNVGNLGGIMRDVNLDIVSFEEQGPDQVLARWRFSCVLDLPWRPLLAAAGSTTHVVDLKKGQVVKHIEAWDVDPNKVLKQLLRPASRMPSNAIETFMLSASEGDVRGMWFATTPLWIKITLPVVGVSLLCKAVTGEGLPGVALGTLEGVSWLLAVAALGTEVYKLIGNRPAE